MGPTRRGQTTPVKKTGKRATTFWQPADRRKERQHNGSPNSTSPSQTRCASSPFLGYYAFVLFAVLLCFVRTPFGELVNDDIYAIVKNADVQARTTITELFKHDFWGKPMSHALSHKSYRPLCVLTFRLNYHLHSLRPFWYRLINVLLHGAISTLLVYVCRTVLGLSSLFCLQCAFLFAVHPIHAEVVNSAVGRADLLACLFFLLAFLNYANCCRAPLKKPDDMNSNKVAAITWKHSKHYWRSLLLSNVFGVAAYLSKENGLCVFGFCIAYDAFIVNQCHKVRSIKDVYHNLNGRMVMRILISLSTVSLLICHRVYLQDGQMPKFTAHENPASHCQSWLTRLMTYTYLCFFNVTLLLYPVTQSYDWNMGSIALVGSWSDMRNVATILFFITVLTFCYLAAFGSIIADDAERRLVFTSIFLLVIHFLPATNLFITVGFVVAERLLYIPSLGYCILACYGLCKLSGSSPFDVSEGSESMNDRCEEIRLETSRRWGMAAVFHIILIACYTWKTLKQNEVWKTRGTLFKAGVEAVPNNAKVHYNYANFLEDEGDKRGAIAHYKRAVELSPKFSSVHNNLGRLLANKQEAVKHFRLALKSEPRSFNAHLNLGATLRDLGEFDQSEKHLKEALRLKPSSTQAILTLTDVSSKKGAWEEGVRLLKSKILASPTDTTLLNSYGTLLVNHEKFDEALVVFNKLHTLDPSHSTPVIQKANALASLKKFDDAEVTLRKFLNKNGNARVAHCLATLYYEDLDRLSDAEDIWREIIKVDASIPEVTFAYVRLLKAQERKEDAFEVLKVFLNHPHSMKVLEDATVELQDMGLLQEALHILDQILTVGKKTAMLFYRKGNILKDLGNFDQSVDAYRSALELDPNLPLVYVNLGAVYHVLGKFDEAKEQYNRALLLDDRNSVAKDNLEKLVKIELLLSQVNGNG